jgi:hypothetical protein
MTILQRLVYSVALAGVGGATITLFIALASADVVGLLPISAFDFIFSPYYLLAVFVIAFLAAPWVVRWLPIARNRS